MPAGRREEINLRRCSSDCEYSYVTRLIGSLLLWVDFQDRPYDNSDFFVRRGKDALVSPSISEALQVSSRKDLP